MDKTQLKRFLVPILKVSVAVGILALMSSKGFLDIKKLLSFTSGSDLVICFLIVLNAIICTGLRWRSLLRGQGFSVSTKDVLNLQFIGVFFNFAVPGGVGGDLVKGYYLVKGEEDKKVLAAMSVIMDRIIGLWVMIMLAVAAGPLVGEELVSNNKLLVLFQFVCVVWGVYTLGLAAAFSDRFYHSKRLDNFVKKLPKGDVLNKIHEAIHSYGKRRDVLVQACLLTLIVQLSSILFFMVIGKAMGYSLPFGAYMFIVPLGFVVTAIPVTPAGIGFGQIGYLALFNMYMGEETQLGPNAITLFQIVTFIWGLYGGWKYISKKKQVIPQKATL